MEALRERFGKYHVLEKIAQGGMAEVYKVKTVGIAGFEKVQALKRILPHQAREARFIRSFIDEARIAVELTHRNIVQVFDFGKADGELFLAMELIEGKDLRTAMTQAVQRGAMPDVEIAAYIISEVASGLDYAHRKADGYGGSLGIVHCDVSPSNVMLSSEGDIKILDFGVARASFASALERRRLRGKPRYMAPEQTTGETPTAASDVFALGIIAWELLTGRPLYHGSDLKAVLEAVRRTDPPRIDRIKPAVPHEVVEAVAIALRRDPAERGTAADLANACVRTAMLAGPRTLARWLRELEARPARSHAAWHAGGTASGTGSAIASPGDAMPARGLPRRAAQPPPLPAAPSAATQDGAAGYPAEDLAERPAAALPGPLLEPDEQSGGPGHGNAFDAAERTERTVRQPAHSAPVEITSTTPMLGPLEAEASTTRMHRLDAAAAADAPEAPHDADDTSDDEFDVDSDPGAAAARAVPAIGDAAIDDDLGPAVSGALAERRRIAIVVGVLSGAPPDVLRPVTKSLGELAYQRGGVVLELEPAALVVAFGLEIAGEDDVAIAMGWALDAAAMARDAAGDSAAVQLRIGARAGVATAPPNTAAPTVTVARAQDAGPRIPPEAIDEARALARDAAPDRPRFVGGPGRLTSSLYELRELPDPRAQTVGRGPVGRAPLGRVPVSGTPASGAPVSRAPGGRVIIEVIGPRSFAERGRARLERRGRFFGRAAQLAELDAWFLRARAANRRLCVLISGPAGIGKSRLVAELVARQASARLRVTTAAASPASRLAPFATVIDLYQASFGLPPARGRTARAEVVRQLHELMSRHGVPDERARAVTGDLERAMELRDGIGLAARELTDLRPRLSAGLATFRTFVTGRTRPVLTIIEDIHHADSASLEVLRHSLEHVEDGAELLVLTTRPEGVPPPAVDGVLALGDLTGDDLQALVIDRLGDAATPAAVTAVLARSGGNPLFIEELAQAVRDAGAAGEDIPASARDVVSARVDRLPLRARTALRFASVLGGTIRTRLLEELLGEDRLARELDELVAAGFLIRCDEAAGPNEGELAFTRGVVREVVYDSLSLRARRDLHAQVGRLLASRYFAGREEPPSVIAEHLERGVERAGAAAFWLRAGRLAMSASDAGAAITCFTRTLTLERELGAIPPSTASRNRRREALSGREEARRLQGDLASDPGDLDELARLCDGDPARLADVAIRRALRLLRLGDYPGAHGATVAAESHAAAGGDDRLRGEALRVRGEILERLARFDDALAVIGTARELFHRQRLIDQEMAAMIGCGRIHVLRAHYDAAHEIYRPVLARVAKTGDPWLERIASNHVAVIDIGLGRFAAAMEHAQRSLELCRRHGDRGREGDALSVSAIVLLEVGLYDQAAATFATALEALSRTNARWSRADCLIYAGICEQRRGRAGGLRLIDEALGEARRLGARYLEACARVARAAVQLRGGALSAAITDAEAGAAVAREATLVGYEIQGLARQALALSRLGQRPADATALVHRALTLLDAQKYLESSEEEVLIACATVLRAAGAHDRAEALRARGRASALRKLAALPDPTWRAAYVAIPEIAALLG